MKVSEGVEHRDRPLDRSRDRKLRGTVRDDGREILTLDEVHDEKRRAAFDEEVDDDRQLRMAKVVEKSRFALERPAVGVVGKVRLLDGDQAIEAIVSRHVDGAHSAAAEKALDAVAAGKLGTWFEGALHSGNTWVTRGSRPVRAS